MCSSALCINSPRSRSLKPGTGRSSCSHFKRDSAKPRNAQRDCAFNVATPRVRSSSANGGANSSVNCSSTGRTCMSACQCGRGCAVAWRTAACGQQGAGRGRAAVFPGCIAEYALAGARRPAILQIEREFQLRLRRRGNHAELALQADGQQGNGVHGRRPAFSAAAAHPQAVVVEPRVDELTAHPDRRDAGLRLK